MLCFVTNPRELSHCCNLESSDEVSAGLEYSLVLDGDGLYSILLSISLVQPHAGMSHVVFTLFCPKAPFSSPTLRSEATGLMKKYNSGFQKARLNTRKPCDELNGASI